MMMMCGWEGERREGCMYVCTVGGSMVEGIDFRRETLHSHAHNIQTWREG